MNAHVQTPPVVASDLPEWDLGDLYAGRDDPRIEADLTAAREAVAELVKLKGAFVAARANAERLGLLIVQAMTVTERFNNLLGSTGAYASLASSVARNDPRVGQVRERPARPSGRHQRRHRFPDPGAEQARGLGDRGGVQGQPGGGQVAASGCGACACRATTS